ncbi:MAG TPA: DUF3750 domain-containing protein [Kofleriaceae bacterium]|jgi:hypothetical protein|nr:DUF3750 domain-containing protein [Kofleriaceae bacterium]
MDDVATRLTPTTAITAAWTTAAVAGVAGCALVPRPLDPPPNDQATVALLTGTLPEPLDEVARHPWFAVRARGARDWTVYEVGGDGITERDPFQSHTPYGHPILHKVWRGAEAERAAACLAREAPPWIAKLQYRFYPGPNSNTFGDVMLRRCDLHASLPATAIGKDWRGVIGAGVTSEGTGVQVESPLLGLKLGLKEGIEVHVLGLSFGVDLWPPALILPLGPGRLGFADR